MTSHQRMFQVDDLRIDALWREHADALMRFATVLVGPSDAPDIASEAFLAAAPVITGGQVSNPSAYLYRAVVNRAHDLRRSRERRWRRDLAAIGLTRSTDDDTFVDVRRAVAELSLAQRTVVFLAYWEDRTERDIAEVLGVSPGTVRRHLVRARLHLRKALQ